MIKYPNAQRPKELLMNRLVTGNLSLVTGDLQKLIPSATLFSISSYQLPVTSYQSKRFLAAKQVRKEQGALHERDVDLARMANEQCAMSNVQCPGRFGLLIAHSGERIPLSVQGPNARSTNRGGFP